MTITQSISTCLAKYATFSGRATRPEFWWFMGAVLVFGWLTLIVDPSGVINMIYSLAFILPQLAAGARRLHDTGRSGHWQWLYLTVIGIIVLIIFWAEEGSKDANEYGEANVRS